MRPYRRYHIGSHVVFGRTLQHLFYGDAVLDYPVVCFGDGDGPLGCWGWTIILFPGSGGVPFGSGGDLLER